VLVRQYRQSDRVWAEPFLQNAFGGPLQARHGDLLDVLALPGFVAERDGRPVGLVTYRLENDECELAFIAALERHAGVGTALLDALLRAVAGCERIWLVTTNDNLEALRFYQRRGFVLSALRPGALDAAREQLKAQISTVGEFGIPLRDELRRGRSFRRQWRRPETPRTAALPKWAEPAIAQTKPHSRRHRPGSL